MRFKVGLVFQYPEYQLFEETVYRDIAFGPKNMKLSEAEVDERVREAARFVGMGEELFENIAPGALGRTEAAHRNSGRHRHAPQGAHFGRAHRRPRPRRLRGHTAKTSSTTGARRAPPSCFVTHSMDDAARIADRLIVFHEGGIAMDGTPDEVFSRARELIGDGPGRAAEPAAIAAALRERGASAARVRLHRCSSCDEAVLALLRKGVTGLMLKDITLGQYFPGDTIVHRLDARTKLHARSSSTSPPSSRRVDWLSYGLMFAVTVGCVALSKIKPRTLMKGLKPLIFVIICFTGVLNLFYTTGGKALFDWWIFTVTTEGLKRAFLMVVRIMMLICGTLLLTYTTSPHRPDGRAGAAARTPSKSCACLCMR